MQITNPKYHRTNILKWAIAQYPINTSEKFLKKFQNLAEASTIVSIENSLTQEENGIDLAFGIVKENMNYLRPKKIFLLPNLSSSNLVNTYIQGIWINMDKRKPVSSFWHYLFFPPFKLGKKFNKELVSLLMDAFNSKSSLDKEVAIKCINQLPASGFIMAFAPPVKRNNFSVRWVIYGMNFLETKKYIHTIFGKKIFIPVEFIKFQWNEMGIIFSIKNGALLPEYGLEFILSKNMNINKLKSLLILLNTEPKNQQPDFSKIKEWVTNHPGCIVHHPDSLGGSLWLNHLKCTIRNGSVHSVKSYFGLAWH